MKARAKQRMGHRHYSMNCSRVGGLVLKSQSSTGHGTSFPWDLHSRIHWRTQYILCNRRSRQASKDLSPCSCSDKRAASSERSKSSWVTTSRSMIAISFEQTWGRSQVQRESPSQLVLCVIARPPFQFIRRESSKLAKMALTCSLVNVPLNAKAESTMDCALAKTVSIPHWFD